MHIIRKVNNFYGKTEISSPFLTSCQLELHFLWKQGNLACPRSVISTNQDTMSFFSRLFGCKKPQPAPAPAPVPVQAKTHEVYDLRHIKDINNIVYYDTCSMPENKTFQRLLEKHFADCDVRQAVAAADLFPHAPAYAMPVNFLLTKDDKQLAIFLLDVRYVKRYSYLETRELCMENGIPFMSFFFHLPNEEDYVVERIKSVIE